MSRAKREKESKINLKIWIPIICIVVVGVTFYMIHDMQKKIEKADRENTMTSEENIVANEAIENEIENEIIADDENSVAENTAQKNFVKNETNQSSNTTSSKTPTQSSVPAQPAVTDQKQKAIELVKKECGNDDTVNYVFDYINENGEYVIAVKDKTSATVKYYFRVNLETQTVELD